MTWRESTSTVPARNIMKTVYGITLDYPISYVTVDHNYVADVPWWEGLDQHGGDHITWSNNTIRRAMYGLHVGMGGAPRPQYTTVIDNHFDSPSPVFYRPADAID